MSIRFDDPDPHGQRRENHRPADRDKFPVEGWWTWPQVVGYVYGDPTTRPRIHPAYLAQKLDARGGVWPTKREIDGEYVLAWESGSIKRWVARHGYWTAG